MPDFIPLKCPTCGAPLEIYGDMERFACGYCGNQVIVQRRGGTVALKAVADAIGKVQEGTDRIAWELELRRLESEVAEETGSVDALGRRVTDLQAKQANTSMGIGCLVGLAISFFVAAAGVVVVSAALTRDVVVGVSFSMLVGAMAVWGLIRLHESGMRTVTAKAKKDEEIANAELKEQESVLGRKSSRIRDLRRSLDAVKHHSPEP